MSVESWEPILLNEVIREDSILLGRGNIISSKDIAEIPGSYPIYSSSAKSNGEFGRYGNFMFDEELITWSIDGGGRFFYRPKHKFSVTNVCGYMRVALSRWDTRFVYYLLDLQHKNIAFDYQTKAHPSVIRNLYFLVRLPIEEQTQIAAILSTIDRAIEQTEAIIAKQQRIKTGLMQDLLTKGIDEDGNVRSEATHKFKDSPLGQIPIEWETEEIVSVLIQSPKNGYSPPEADDWNGTYMLGLGCLTSEGFKPKQLKYAPKNSRLLEAALLQDDDFLISRSNTRALVGLVGIFKHISELCIYPDLMMRLRFNDTVSAEYMEQVFMSSTIRRQIENAATGTSGSMVKINAAAIKKFRFRRPPIDEQWRILSILQSVAEGILEMAMSKAKLQSLKTGLMQDLLTGNVRVTALLNDPKTAKV